MNCAKKQIFVTAHFALEVEVGFELTPIKVRGVADRSLKPLDYSTILCSNS